jgi:hypothetical protein
MKEKEKREDKEGRGEEKQMKYWSFSKHIG